MQLYNRYIHGQTEEVYQDIYLMGQDAFLPANFPEIDKVFTETFQRVSYNLDIIYGIKDFGFWWTSTEENKVNAYYRTMNTTWIDIYKYSCFKSAGFSVRCIKD